MAQAGAITAAQLVGDTFQASQLSTGNNSANGDGSYTYTATGNLSGLANSITVTQATGTETFTATVSGGLGNGQTINGTILANGPSSVLATVVFGGTTYTIYETNNPSDQPAQGTPITVPAIGANNPYTYMMPCFASGTMIRTVRGDVAVEALRVGDLAVVASGALRRVSWLGHRTLRPASHGEPWSVNPVLVRAGAFGAMRPERDLLMSPGHPVLVGADEEGEGGHLVPIMCLINGTTIERVAVDEVTYWHVELEAHDILLAEGLAAESYLDWGDRVFFSEGGEHALANPDFVVPGLAGRCRPVALDGPVVEAERRRLDAIFAMRLGEACEWPAEDMVLAEA